jgi:hypothetical protein
MNYGFVSLAGAQLCHCRCNQDATALALSGPSSAWISFAPLYSALWLNVMDEYGFKVNVQHSDCSRDGNFPFPGK